jgi:hypothetical protein
MNGNRFLKSFSSNKAKKYGIHSLFFGAGCVVSLFVSESRKIHFVKAFLSQNEVKLEPKTPVWKRLPAGSAFRCVQVQEFGFPNRDVVGQKVDLVLGENFGQSLSVLLEKQIVWQSETLVKGRRICFALSDLQWRSIQQAVAKAPLEVVFRGSQE